MSNEVLDELPFAYRFQSDLTQDEILDKLNAVGPWTWLGGDSDYDGFYLRAVPGMGTKLKILGETPPHYTIEIDFIPSMVEDLTLEELHRVTVDDLLPALGARNIANDP